MSSTAPKTNESQAGYKAYCLQRGETIAVAHSTLVPKQGFNSRLVFEGIEELASSIQVNGFRKSTPLIVEWNKDLGKFEILHGERRYRAILWLVEQGIDPGPIWCMPESRSTSSLQKLFDQVITNTGTPFNLLEKGLHYLRIQDEKPGITGTEIAAAVGETKQATSNALRLAKHASQAIREAIIAGRIACTTALSIVDSAKDDHPRQDEILGQTLSSASGKGRDHATPANLPKPPADPETPAPSEPGEPTAPDDSEDTAVIIAPDDPEPEQPSPGSDTGTAKPTIPGADATAHIRNAPSTNRDGSSGPGEGKSQKPDKRIKNLDRILDAIDASGKGNPDRITTAEILIGYLNNERQLKEVRKHLTQE